jgi:hypothetical protein
VASGEDIPGIFALHVRPPPDPLGSPPVLLPNALRLTRGGADFHTSAFRHGQPMGSIVTDPDPGKVRLLLGACGVTSESHCNNSTASLARDYG